MATIIVVLLINLYMIEGPAHWLQRLMQLTYVAGDFKLYIITLGIMYLGLAWVGENFVFQRLARLIGRAKESLTKREKVRKQYKVILEQMLF